MRRTHARLFTSLAAPLAAGGLVLSGLAAVPAAAADAPDATVDRLAGQVVEGTGKPAAKAPATQRGFAQAATPVRRTTTITRFESNPVPSSPAQRMNRVVVTQDLQKGEFVAQVALAAAPTQATNAVVAVYLGDYVDGLCTSRISLVGESFGSGSGGAFQADEADLKVKRSRSGATVTLRSTALNNRVKAARPECALAITAAGDGTTLHKSVGGELEDVHAPRLIIKPGQPVQGNYAGKVTTVRVEVRNDSLSAATGVRLRASGKGMKIAKPVRTLGTIDKRSSERGIVFKVRLNGAKPRKLVFQATTAGRTFAKRITIARKPKPTRLPSLTGRYFWGHMGASVNTGWDNRAAYFVNNRFVHLGFPKAGKRPVCRKATKNCKRYVYNARTGRLKIAKAKPVRVTSEGFTFRKATYYPTTLAKKGQRFNVELMRHDFNGNCLIFCTTWTEWLVLQKNGRFALSRVTIGSWGGPGAGGQWSSIPPDERGTYRVIAPGRVQLTFANGKKEGHTLAIDHDVRNKPSPRGAGLILGDRNFYLGD